MTTLANGHTFSPEEAQWARPDHNAPAGELSIDQDDFDTRPIFTRSGGWKKANNVFKDRLPALLKEVNMVIAA